MNIEDIYQAEQIRQILRKCADLIEVKWRKIDKNAERGTTGISERSGASTSERSGARRDTQRDNSR